MDYGLNLVAQIILVISVIGTTLAMIAEHRNRIEYKTKNIGKEIENLNNISESLKGLQTFINSQKNHLIQNEKIISELEKRKEELKPLVETQEQTVEAILKAHTATQKKSTWIGHLVGFFIGVASSAIVTLIFYHFQK